MLFYLFLHGMIGLVLAKPTPSFPRLPTSLLSPTTDNFTANDPQVFCQIDGLVLSTSQIQDCENAIAFLPVSSPEVKIFGPYQRDFIYRTPIVSRKGDCEAIVSIRHPGSVESSSWEEVSKMCLNYQHQVGFARVGRHYILELLVKYFNPGFGGGGQSRSNESVPCRRPGCRISFD